MHNVDDCTLVEGTDPATILRSASPSSSSTLASTSITISEIGQSEIGSQVVCFTAQQILPSEFSRMSLPPLANYLAVGASVLVL